MVFSVCLLSMHKPFPYYDFTRNTHAPCLLMEHTHKHRIVDSVYYFDVINTANVILIQGHFFPIHRPQIDFTEEYFNVLLTYTGG